MVLSTLSFKYIYFLNLAKYTIETFFRENIVNQICYSASKARRKKRSYSSKSWSGSASEDNGISPPVCRLRYQQTSVDVHAHFFATDHESGRTTYLINRRTWLRVTDLVLPWLRVSDPRIASLHGRILQGRSVGRTEVQVYYEYYLINEIFCENKISKFILLGCQYVLNNQSRLGFLVSSIQFIPLIRQF